MKMFLNNIPAKLLNKFYEIFDKEISLLQILDFKGFNIYAIPFSIPHLEILKKVYILKSILKFNSIYFFNVIDGNSTLYLNTINKVFDLPDDGNGNLNSDEIVETLKFKSDLPWIYPYDKVLLPDLNSLELIIVDIEEIRLSFFLVSVKSNHLSKLHEELISFLGDHHNVNYLDEGYMDVTIKNKIIQRCFTYLNL